MPLVITDASILIGLEQIGHLHLLPGLFDEVVAPPAVVAEFGHRPDWLREVSVADRTLVTAHRAHLLDEGEAEAIALAREHPGATLLMDERRGRRYAEALGIPIVGTAGLLVRAKQRGLIAEVRPLLDDLRAVGFWLSDPLYALVLALAGEA